MSFSLPVDAPWFRQSLSETVVWCTAQPIDDDPVEDAAVRERRNLGSKAAELVRRAFSVDKNEFWKSHDHACARRLFEKARLEEIAPLENPLRSSLSQAQILQRWTKFRRTRFDRRRRRSETSGALACRWTLS
jgi:hypothetical protein